jgi:hypothetical protein
MCTNDMISRRCFSANSYNARSYQKKVAIVQAGERVDTHCDDTAQRLSKLEKGGGGGGRRGITDSSINTHALTATLVVGALA